MVALLCQPSSEASTVHKLDDERNATGLAACSLALSCQPSVFCGENVASFKKRQRPTFDALMRTLAVQYGSVKQPAPEQVSAVYLNAFHCMVPQPRNRVWIVAVEKGIDRGPLLTAVRKQKALCQSGVATCPTLREELSNHHSGMHRMDGLFIPSLRGCPQDRSRARRVISTDCPAAEGGTMKGGVTVTTKMLGGERGRKAMAKHKFNRVDAAPRERTMVASEAEWGG